MAPNHKKAAREAAKATLAKNEKRKVKLVRFPLRGLLADTGFAVLVSLFAGLVLASFSAAGIITITLAIILLFLAWGVGIGGSFLLKQAWDPSPRDRFIFAAILAIALSGIGRFELEYQGAKASPVGIESSTSTGQPTVSQPGAGTPLLPPATNCLSRQSGINFDQLDVENGGGPGIVIEGNPNLCISHGKSAGNAGPNLEIIPGGTTNPPVSEPPSSGQPGSPGGKAPQ